MEFKQLSPPVQQDLPSVSGTTRAIMPTLADGTSDRVKATGGNDEPEANENDNNAMNDDNEEERKAAAGESEPTSNTITYRNAQLLCQREWDEIIAINKLLHGFQIRNDVPDVVRARLPAFVLKNPDKAPGGVKPSFQVVDGSIIQINESQNAFQRSLAQNAFSKKSIDTELSAGDMGIQGGFSGGRGRDHSTTHKDGQRSQEREYHASYDFPRARVFLDEYELDISDDCKEQLRKVETRRNEQSLREFDTKYGHVFVTSVVLGGQQRTTKFAGAIELKSDEQKQDAMRGALGAKILAPYISGSFQYSKSRGSDSSHQDDRYIDVTYLGMSASGGDTLIGADVPNWVKTVASSENWRVIGNETAIPLARLLALVTRKPWIPGLFLWIREGGPLLSSVTTRPYEKRRSEFYELEEWLTKR